MMLCLFLPYNKWISYIHTYIHTCMHTYPPSWVFPPPHSSHPSRLSLSHTEHQAEFPVLKSAFPLAIYFTHGSVLVGEGSGDPLQYSCLENPMDGGAWWAAVHGVAKNQTRLSDFTFTFQFHTLKKEMATHSSVLAWRIPGMGEPGGLPSMGSHSQTRLKWHSSSSSVPMVYHSNTIRMCLFSCVFTLNCAHIALLSMGIWFQERNQAAMRWDVWILTAILFSTIFLKGTYRYSLRWK